MSRNHVNEGYISLHPAGIPHGPHPGAMERSIGKKKTDGLTQMARTVTDFDDFQVGDNVEHSIFGAGKIMALSGTGENQRVGVVFNDGTRKKLIVKFANLKKL